MHKLWSAVICSLATLAFAQPATADPNVPLKLDPKSQIPSHRKPPSIRDGFTMAVTGDLVGPGIPVVDLEEPEFEKLTQILQRATLAVGNNETHIMDMRTTKARPVAGDTQPVKRPEIAKDYARMGFDVLNLANNHQGDWGEEGMFETQKWLQDAGIVTMGFGPNRFFAQQPAYVNTRYGRVAFIGFTNSLNHPNAAPADAVGGAPGRAGPNFVRLSEDNKVDRYDQYAILRNVREAKESSDMLVIYTHSHPDPKYLRDFYHDLVDAGADAIVGSDTVPDVRGIEIYHGVPIIFGLEPFFYAMFEGYVNPQYRYEAIDVDPRSATYAEVVRKQMGYARQDTYFTSAIAELKASGGRVSEIRIYPTDLQKDATDYHNGHPRLADAKLGAAILGELQKVSSQYGTTITVEDNVGIIRIP